MPLGRKVNSRRIVPINASGVTFDKNADLKNDGDAGDDDDNMSGEHHDFERQMLLDLDDFQKDISSAPNTARGPQDVINLQDDSGNHEDGQVEEDEVALAHDIPGAGKKSIESMRVAFQAMMKQVEEYKKRAAGAIERNMEAQKKLFDLEEKCDMQEDEINTLQLQLQSGGNQGPGGIRIIGGGGGANKMRAGNNANDQLRQELAETGDEQDVDLGLTEIDGAKSIMVRFKAWAAKRKPFQKDIRTVQGKFGSAVASYFVFWRFIFMQCTAITLVGAAFAVLHLSLFIEAGNTSFEDLTSGSGLLPRFMLYSTFEPEEAFQYSMFVIFGLLVFSATALEHLVTEDLYMKRIDASEEGNEVPYSQAVLGSWDNGGLGYQPTSRQLNEQKGSLGNSFIQLLDDQRTSGIMKSRSRFELLVLYSRRAVASLLYISVQASSFAAIVLLTIYTEDITNYLRSTPFKNFASALAPVALNTLNSLSPPLMKAITDLEKWDSGQMNLNVLLFRMYLSNILNTLILALSYLLLADPLLLAQFPTVRGALELAENDLFRCRLDQTADAMFSLYTTNFFISNFVIFAIGYGWQQIHPLLSRSATMKGLLGEYEPFPFEVEPAMINLFNSMSLVMITFPFAPTAVIFLPFAIYVTIKIEVYCILHFNGKPERTWKAHQSGVIFTSFYLVTLCLIGIPITVLFLSSANFPKSCDIQDKVAGLCASGGDDCTKDQNSEYYEFYKDIKYPYEFCSRKCGPFVDYDNNLEPFKEKVFLFSWLQYTWEFLFDYSYVPWLIVIGMLVLKWRAKNTKLTRVEREQHKERVLTVQIESLEAEKRKQDKIINRLKSQHSAAEEAAQLRNLASPR